MRGVGKFGDGQRVQLGAEQHGLAGGLAVEDCRHAMPPEARHDLIGIQGAQGGCDARGGGLFLPRHLGEAVQIAAQGGQFHQIGVGQHHAARAARVRSATSISCQPVRAIERNSIN